MSTESIRINTETPYDVIVGENLLENCGEMAKAVTEAKTAAIITDDIVAKLYVETVNRAFRFAGFRTKVFVFKNGEESKCHQTLMEIYSFLNDSGITRTDLIVALGGGVVGDLTGFAAATYLRGVPFIQIPTTLLAAVDSSVGGKTAVDIAQGKNLVGAFYQPRLVICDTNTLKTLKPETFSDGAAEVIKYGAIYDADLFARLENGELMTNTADIICRCVDIKREVVEKDEFDTGLRNILNFGHTLGHAVEKHSGYKITHGTAVAAGMVEITRASVKRGFTSPDAAKRLAACVESYGLESRSPYPLEDIIDHCMSDKKRSGESITMVLLKKIGTCFLHPVKTSVFKSILLD